MPKYDEKGFKLNESAIDYKSDSRFTNPAIDYAKDPRFVAPQEEVQTASAIDYKNDPRFTQVGIDYAKDPRFTAPVEVASATMENEVKPYSQEWLEGKDLPDQMPSSDRDTVLKNRKESWLKGEDLPDQMPSSDKDEVLGVRRAQEDAKNRPEQAEEKTETDKWLEGEDLPDQMPTSDKEKVIAERQKQHDAWLEGKDLPDQIPTSDKEKVIAERQKQEEAKNHTDDTEVLSETMEDEQERISDLADKTIRGEYGNGQERKDALGDDYEKVQKEVNERMEKVKDEGLTAENGKEFDAAYYAENNPDVVQAYGNDPKSLLNHYNEYGQYEGRKASSMDAPQQTSGIMNYLGELSAQEGDMDFELKDGSILSIENNNGKAEFFLDGNSLGSNADAVERKLISQGHMDDVSKNGLDELIKQNTVPNNTQQTNENLYQVYMSIMNGEKTV